MTFVPVTTGATTAAAAAAAHQRELEREEEQMTNYDAADLEGWEFKIVRTATRKFKDPEFLRRVREEEARSGWQMLEKFDDQRVRFKREIEHRGGDLHREIDPYRTNVGLSGARMEVLIGVVSLAVVGVVLAVVLFIKMSG
jgi:hypothetical protein